MIKRFWDSSRMIVRKVNLEPWYTDNNFKSRQKRKKKKRGKPCFNSPGPKNWQPLALTAAHRFADNCCGFWCCRISSVTVLSLRERAARIARARPSSSISWQLTKATSFLCMGLLRMALVVPAPIRTHKRTTEEKKLLWIA